MFSRKGLASASLLALFLTAFLGSFSVLQADDSKNDSAAAPEVEHPETALCRACALRGAQHGEEDVVAMREWNGSFYYFCSEPCAEAFDAFPAAYETKTFPRPAPTATVEALDGSKVELKDLLQSGDAVLLDFWATWCKPCEKSMPEIQELHAAMADEGLRVLGISIDEKGVEHVRDWLEDKDIDYPIAVDTSERPAWYVYGVPAVPAMLLIDRKGQIVAEWKGMVDMEQVRPKIREVLRKAG